MLGRGRRALFDVDIGESKSIALDKLRQSFVLLLLREIRFPSGNRDRSALGGKAVTAAFESNGGFSIAAGLAHSHQHLTADEQKHFSFTGRQGGKVGLARNDSGDDRMVVGDLFTVADLRGIDDDGRIRPHNTGGAEHGGTNGILHIVG